MSHKIERGHREGKWFLARGESDSTHVVGRWEGTTGDGRTQGGVGMRGDENATMKLSPCVII